MTQKHVSGKPLDGVSPHRGGIAASTQTALTGKPFNFVGGVALQAMLAQQAGLSLGEFVWMGGDVHLYRNHVTQAREQLTRAPRPLPTLRLLRKPDSIDGYTIDDFVVDGYDPHPPIQADVAV